MGPPRDVIAIPGGSFPPGFFKGLNHGWGMGNPGYLWGLLAYFFVLTASASEVWQNPYSGAWYMNSAAAWQSVVSMYPGHDYAGGPGPLDGVVNQISGGYFIVHQRCDSTGCDSGKKSVYEYACNAGFSWSDQSHSCTAVIPSCPDGQTWDAALQACRADCAALAGTMVSACVPGSNLGSPYASVDGCRVVVQQATNQWQQNGQPAICGAWSYTGDASTQAVATRSESQDSTKPCAEGQTRGEVNGVWTCLSTSPSTVNNKTTETVNPDGSKSVTTVNTEYNSTTNETTITTTITTFDASGTQTGQDTTTETTRGNEPTKPGSSHGSIECSTQAPECKGDAIQCAVSLQLWRLRCDATEAEKTAIQDMRENAGKDAIKANPAVDGGAINLPASLEQDAWLGGGSCPGDQTISLGGYGSLVLPWSTLCSHLNTAGAGLVVVSLLLAIRIMTRRNE